MDIDSTTIQAILQAAHRVRPTRVEKPGEIKPFDFHVPHRFTSEHTKKLRDVSDVLARGLTATLSATLQGAFPIALGDIKEMYVSLQDTPAGAYYVPLNFNKQLAGYLLLPRDTAIG
jgi:flagellar motor switch protein FliM